MTEPKNSIVSQYLGIFRNEGVALKIAPEVFAQIAQIAIEYKTGARGLRGICEELIGPLLYAIPNHPEIGTAIITSLFEKPRLEAQQSPVDDQPI